MAVPKTTLWKRSPHTEGKHLVLEHYLNAWFAILGRDTLARRILFVDGFAGPGRYEGGEEGSPVVAMRVLAEHSAAKRINALRPCRMPLRSDSKASAGFLSRRSRNSCDRMPLSTTLGS